MSDFVEQCRREWTRLGVPGSLAEEMAEDLAADLREAEADGISAEELLGSSARDPRAFAASWAAERGIIPASRDEGRARRKSRVLIAFTAVAAVALVVAVALLVTGEPRVGITTNNASVHFPPAQVNPSFFPPPGRVSTSAATPIEWVLLVLALVALGFAAWLWSNWGRARESLPA